MRQVPTALTIGNVPLTPRDKGYRVSTMDIGDRLEALDDQVREAWRRRYDQAFQQWQRVAVRGVYSA